MSLKHGLLGLLNYGPMTGYELHKAFEASLGFFWQATQSQVYRELNAMEQGGFLSSERVIQEERPNKRVYSITDAGRSELMQWLSSPGTDIDNALNVRSAFLMRIFFAGEVDSNAVISMLREYREKCAEGLRGLGGVPNSIAEYGELIDDESKMQYWKITALYGEEFYRVGMLWAEKAITLLEGSV